MQEHAPLAANRPPNMLHHLADEQIPYTGRELRSHWIRDTFGIGGNAVVAFIGPCEVPLEAMVDLADVCAGQPIQARSMLHFIAEFFDQDLDKTILHQRLLVALAGEMLRGAREQHPDITPPGAARVTREGDDLYIGTRKLSVSIATASPVSTLIHLGINIDPEGAPVEAIGLAELQVDPLNFARALIEAYIQEITSVAQARCKVRAVT